MIIKEQTLKYINLIGIYQLETSSEAVTPQSSDSRSILKTQKYVFINYNKTLKLCLKYFNVKFFNPSLLEGKTGEESYAR